MNDNRRHEAHPPADEERENKFAEIRDRSTCILEDSGHCLRREDYEAADRDSWETVIITSVREPFISFVAGDGLRRLWSHSALLLKMINQINTDGGDIEWYEPMSILRASINGVRVITGVGEGDVTPCKRAPRLELPKPPPSGF